MATKLVAVTERSLSAMSNSSAAIAGGMLLNPVTYGFSAILFAAQTTADWRKVKKGSMTKQEFKKRMKSNGVGMGGGILGASGGAATGFLVGSLICPGIGSAIGTFGGAICGGLLGQKLAKNALNKIDAKIEETKRLKKEKEAKEKKEEE